MKEQVKGQEVWITISMDMRDWFASIALEGILSQQIPNIGKPGIPQKKAELAYKYAEAMIKESKKPVQHIHGQETEKFL